MMSLIRIFQLDDKENEIRKLRDRVYATLGNSIEVYVTAPDLKQGIEIIENEDFDVYIIDGEFPKETAPDGEDMFTLYKYMPLFNFNLFCERLREIKLSPRIFIYSGYSGRNKTVVKRFDPDLPFYSKNKMESLIERLKYIASILISENYY